MSPLIALMSNQVFILTGKGMKAAYIGPDQDVKGDNDYSIIYGSPEALLSGK